MTNPTNPDAVAFTALMIAGIEAVHNTTTENAERLFKAALKRCPDPCTMVQIAQAVEQIIVEEIDYGL